MIQEAYMSDSLGFLLVAVAAAWLVIGLMLSLVMGRRGHDGFSWLVMGSLLGPLAIVLALNSSRHEQLGPTVLDTATHARSAGTVDVLVGHDGSPEAGAVLEAAIRLFGPRLGRLTLATVVPFDGGAEVEPQAEVALRRVARLAKAPNAELEVLHGRPAEALRQRAAEGGYSVLAVGTRGQGVAGAVLGSTAAELARSSKVPVLMVGPSTTET